MGIFTKFFETFSPILFFVGTFISSPLIFILSFLKKRKQSIKSRLHGLPDFVKIYFAMGGYCQLLLQTWDACLITDDYHRKVLPINWWEFKDFPPTAFGKKLQTKELLVNHIPGKIYLFIVDFWSFFVQFALLRIRKENKLTIQL